MTGIPDGTLLSASGTPIESSSMTDQVVAYAQDYSAFFSKVNQSLTTPNATRYAVQYEGTLSYNYNAILGIISGYNSWTVEANLAVRGAPFTNIINYNIEFMCVLNSVLETMSGDDTLSRQELSLTMHRS